MGLIKAPFGNYFLGGFLSKSKEVYPDLNELLGLGETNCGEEFLEGQVFVRSFVWFFHVFPSSPTHCRQYCIWHDAVGIQEFLLYMFQDSKISWAKATSGAVALSDTILARQAWS